MGGRGGKKQILKTPGLKEKEEEANERLALFWVFFILMEAEISVYLQSGICCKEFLSPVASPLKSVAWTSQGLAACLCPREGVNCASSSWPPLPLTCNLNEL